MVDLDASLAALERHLFRLPLCRQLVDRIDPRTTVVLVLAENLPEAITHYRRTCDLAPEYRVLDADRLPADQWAAIVDAGRPLGVAIGMARELHEYLGRDLCVYARRITPFWKPGGPLQTYFAAQRLGLHGRLLFDQDSLADHMYMVHVDPLPRGYFDQHRAKLARGYAAMADAESRAIYAGALLARLTGHSGYIPPALGYKQYFHPKVVLQPGDTMVEGGAELGDTTAKFADIVGAEGRIVAFEPVPAHCDHLRRKLGSRSNIQIEAQGLWSGAAVTEISVTGGGSRIQETLTADNPLTAGYQDFSKVRCQVIDLDTYFDQHPQLRCDMLKLDIEGAELPALRGSVRTLRRFRPKLAISVYHYPLEQFVEIIDFLIGLDLGYTFYLGHHDPFYTETMVYAHC